MIMQNLSVMVSDRKRTFFSLIYKSVNGLDMLERTLIVNRYFRSERDGQLPYQS